MAGQALGIVFHVFILNIPWPQKHWARSHHAMEVTDESED
jgi:hypothetical protein